MLVEISAGALSRKVEILLERLIFPRGGRILENFLISREKFITRQREEAICQKREEECSGYAVKVEVNENPSPS